jgi:GT2 family glycosyltransferase
VKVRSASRRLRATLRRVGGRSATEPWCAYLGEVEASLAARPRLHRFATPPVIGEATAQPLPLAVWIDGEGDAAARTKAALEAGTLSPSTLLDGPLEEALTHTRAEHVMLVRAGDEPAALALERLGQAAALAPDAAILTCDDDEVSRTGRRHSPHFRPGPSPDRWLAYDDSGPLLVVHRERARAAASEVVRGDAWRHELALKLAGPGGAQHGHVPLILVHCAAESQERRPGLTSAGVARVLQEWEPRAHVDVVSGVRRIRRPLTGEPSVEVIVCFRDKPGLLRRCVDSVLDVTTYERFGMTLVDNGSVESETRAVLDKAARDPRVSTLRDERPFNFAALNNSAAQRTDADVLVFLNNDTEVLDEAWMETLLEEATRPEIGAVAPLLLYPDGKVQHAGAAIGLHGYAGHPFAGLSPDADTPFGSASDGTRNWLAVTAACMMVERAKFTAVGGFDERFVVAGNDVDLCLRLTAAGHRSLFVPHTQLLHDESRSRGSLIDPDDFAASERSYGTFRTMGDPFYNPNLTLRSTDCQVRAADEPLP